MKRLPLLLLAFLLLAGCAKSLKTVRVPAEPSSVRAELPDTLAGVSLDEIAPIDPAGVPTEPLRVARLADTIDAPTAEVVRAQIGPNAVTFTLPTVEYTFERPAWGETLHVLARGNHGGLRAEVTGEPEARELEAEVLDERKPWPVRLWKRLTTSLAWIGLFALVGFSLFVAARLGLVSPRLR